MRFNETCILLAHGPYTEDEYGYTVEGEATEREVFCNEYSVGIKTYESSVNIGLRADVILVLREVDYEGEKEVVYRGVQYSVERTETKGEFIRLQLGVKAGDIHGQQDN